jgi:hypothetical protein
MQLKVEKTEGSRKDAKPQRRTRDASFALLREMSLKL